MNRPRISIGSLMALVLLIAVGLAALRYPSRLAASALFTAAFVSLTLALVGVVHRRSYWTGLVVCGWAYFLAAFGPWSHAEFGPYLLGTVLSDFMFQGPSPAKITPTTLNLGPPTPWEAWTEIEWGTQMRVYGTSRLGGTEPLRRVGNSLATLLFALVGGTVGRSFAAKGEHP